MRREMEEMEKKAAELMDKIVAAQREATEAKTALAEMEKRIATNDSEKDEQKNLIAKLDESINLLNDKLNKINTKREGRSFEDSVREVLESDKFKSELQEVISKKRSATSAFEVKDDPSSVITSGLTGDVTRTVTPGIIYSAGYEPNKFLAACTPVVIPQDKNRAMWFDGTYYSNVGYMTELTGITTGDGAALEEKYREIAKVGAKLPFSAEAVSDMSYFVNWAKNEGLRAVLNDIDTKIFEGDGEDGSSNTKHVYGISSQGATAFSATTAGLATAIEEATIADLIAACATQIDIQSKGQYAANAAFVHPANVTKIRSLKNKLADYLNILPNGQMQIHGINILSTSKVGVDELLVCDTSTLKLYQKGSYELEVERVPSTDSFVMYLRWRGQVVVPTYAKLGNIWCSSIATAIASITTDASPLLVELYTTAAPTTLAPTTAAPTTTVAPTTTNPG